MSRCHRNPEAASRLSPEQYRVTQRDGTERPFDNAFWVNKEPGVYVDVAVVSLSVTSRQPRSSG